MYNKTCGECRFFESKNFICCHSGDEVEAHFIACSDFEQKRKPTNGDVIRQMDDEDLANVLSDDCPPFRGDSGECKHPYPDVTRKDCWREWLNAPAKEGVEDE